LRENKDLELCKQIYEYAIRQFIQINDSKKHLESKCMNVLQASSILVILFVGLMQYFGSIVLIKSLNIIYILSHILFYISIVSTICIIILSLNDSIENIRIRLLKKFKKNIVTDKTDIKDVGKYIPLPDIKDIQAKLDNKGLKCYYESLVECYNNSINSIRVIVLTKNTLFLTSLKTFDVFQKQFR